MQAIIGNIKIKNTNTNMKLSRLSLISLAVLLGLGFASCERKYDAPLLADPTVTPGDEKVITIAEYKDKFKKVPKEGR